MNTLNNLTHNGTVTCFLLNNSIRYQRFTLILTMGDSTNPITTAILATIPSSWASSIGKNIRTAMAPTKNKLQISAKRDKKEKPAIKYRVSL
ncbi:hypothetical protein [Sediminibacterium goheungense]|uniref:hypothetical protein n=1 Tax=Sediminibacterium goheungense TaxID=1086393 RepID=UPI00105D6F98|nr:hypothetical protein [Sediminibacterium goheungense]